MQWGRCWSRAGAGAGLAKAVPGLQSHGPRGQLGVACSWGFVLKHRDSRAAEPATAPAAPGRVESSELSPAPQTRLKPTATCWSLECHRGKGSRVDWGPRDVTEQNGAGWGVSKMGKKKQIKEGLGKEKGQMTAVAAAGAVRH